MEKVFAFIFKDPSQAGVSFRLDNLQGIVDFSDYEDMRLSYDEISWL